MTKSAMADKNIELLPTESLAFLGKKVADLSVLIEQQTQPVFDHQGIVIPVKSCSLMICLLKLESASAADLARALNQSHQLVVQKLPGLEKLKLLSWREDPEDRRRKVYRLSSKGKKLVALLEKSVQQFESVYRQLFKETNVNLIEAIEAISNGLSHSSLYTRMIG